ncbi:LptF/LptG family permease [Leptolyngbya sp. FACHB-261]|nr:LptF/LptG family permease [Leptolyngbya sp. FACHB-261]
MDAYLGQELTLPFVFGVGAFSSIGLSIGSLLYLVRQVAESGLPIMLALQIFALQMPYFVALAFPMSTLLATLMAYGRLSDDHEIIALRGCGISVYRLFLPALVLSLVVTGMTFLFNEVVVPSANYRASVMLDAALNGDRNDFQDTNILYNQYDDLKQPDGQEQRVLTRLFYAREFDGRQMRGLTVLDFSEGSVSQIISAETADWQPKSNRWRFYNGTIYLISQDGSYRNILRFQQHEANLPRAPLDLAQERRGTDEMNIVELNRYIDLIRPTSDAKKLRKLYVRLQQKLAFPFVCVAFALVGASLGLRIKRSGKGLGLGLSVLIIFMYYVLLFITGALGQVGALSPFVAAWSPVWVALVAGTFLLWRAAR